MIKKEKTDLRAEALPLNTSIRSMSFYIFIIWTFILFGRPQDFFPSLAPFRLALLFTFLAVITTFLDNRKISLTELLKTREGKRYALFYFVMIVGIPFAYYRREAFFYIFFLYLSNILFFIIFCKQIDSVKKMKDIIFTICVSAFTYGAMSLAKGSMSEGRIAFGTMYDPNDLAYYLVSLFPLCIFYIVHREGFLKKLFALTTIGVSLIIILQTGSRGGFLGLVALSAMLFFSKQINIKFSVKIIVLIVAATVFLSYSDKINTERYASLNELRSDYNVTGEEGRIGIWKRGLQFIVSNPLTGVGVNCFPMAIGYNRAAIGEIPRWQVAHNSYLQIGAETGLLGIYLFAALITGSLRTFSQYRRSETASHEADQIKTIAGLLRVAFVGSLISAFFLTQGYSILFTLFFAFSAVLNKFRTAQLTVQNK